VKNRPEVVSVAIDEKEAEEDSTEAVTTKDLALLRIRLRRKLQRLLLIFLQPEKTFASFRSVVLKKLERT
jgi:hypothetical protein